MLPVFNGNRKQGMIFKEESGQFVIIAALMIAIMIVSIAVVMYSTVSYYRYESWEEYTGVVDNVMAGSKQVLMSLLASYTKNVYESGITNKSFSKVLLSRWATDLYKAFPSYGLNASFSERYELVDMSAYGINYRRPVYGFIKCYWYHFEGLSSVCAEAKIDALKFGLYGHNISALYYLFTKVDTSYLGISPPPNSIININVTVISEEGPVTDLNQTNFEVLKFDPNVGDWVSVGLSKTEMVSAGRYVVSFRSPISKPYYEWLIVVVRDNRGIYVKLSTYTSIEFEVQRATPTNKMTNSTDEIYTLECGIGGHWYWNGKELSVIGDVAVLPPFPPIPIKQFRVNVTETGSSGPFVTSPCQYEIWDRVNWHGKTIEVPRGLADPWAKFNASSRIVFQVKFPQLNIQKQKVRIYWLDDLDAPPYQGPSDLTYDSNIFTANTNRYRVEFIGVGHTKSPTYPYDYYGVAALVMINPSNGLCFGPWNLHAFGIYSGSLGEWRPYGQWQIKYWYQNTDKRAVVRLLAILNSTRVQNVYNPSAGPRSDYYDTYAVVFITANVKYLQLNVHIYWKQAQTDNGLWFASIMGNGGPTNYAFLNYTTGTVAGPYQYNYNNPQHREYRYPGYWAAHWNNQFGRGLIINDVGVQNLRNINAARTRFSVTERAPSGSRQGSIELEAINCDGGSYTTYAGLSYSYPLVMWMYNGGNYAEVNNYYYMFLESYAPKIVVSG
ncbi:MAG: hypothetical protein QXJ07_04300 [Candidatus Bathyarchaeia archaeon]